MQTRIERGMKVLTAEDGKELYCKILERNYGDEVWLGYVYYNKDGERFPEPYLLREEDFIEIDKEVVDDNTQ